MRAVAGTGAGVSRKNCSIGNKSRERFRRPGREPLHLQILTRLLQQLSQTHLHPWHLSTKNPIRPRNARWDVSSSGLRRHRVKDAVGPAFIHSVTRIPHMRKRCLGVVVSELPILAGIYGPSSHPPRSPLEAYSRNTHGKIDESCASSRLQMDAKDCTELSSGTVQHFRADCDPLP